jgi:hypothetical protein
MFSLQPPRHISTLPEFTVPRRPIDGELAPGADIDCGSISTSRVSPPISWQVLSICIGSAIQVALVFAPLLVIISWFIGRPMNLVFSNPLHLFAIAGAAFIVNAIARDGETTWFEGLLLVGVYVLFGLAFFFTG